MLTVYKRAVINFQEKSLIFKESLVPLKFHIVNTFHGVQRPARALYITVD